MMVASVRRERRIASAAARRSPETRVRSLASMGRESRAEAASRRRCGALASFSAAGASDPVFGRVA